jgi:hypothetical protein
MVMRFRDDLFGSVPREGEEEEEENTLKAWL